MNEAETLQAYRRMVATPDDSSVDWWYAGWTFVEIDGHPEIPLMSVTAIMSYRTETLDARRFRIHWSEIGIFRDPATGEAPREWVNPVTGKRIAPPRQFEEGPGAYIVSAAGASVALELLQPHAHVHALGARMREESGRIYVNQVERKWRGFPLADGSLPAPGSAAGFEAVTQLSFFASAADSRGTGNAFVPCQGTYLFTLSGVPGWMGFGERAGRTITRGVITKAPPGVPLDPVSYRRLGATFPGKTGR
jgi:hypothetical protein